MEATREWMGGETVRNRLGRAPVGRSDAGVARGWAVGKL